MPSLADKKVSLMNRTANILKNLLPLESLEFSLYKAVKGYQETHNYVKKKVEQALEKGESEEKRIELLLQTIDELEAQEESKENKIITQIAIIEDLDGRITYDESESRFRISLKCLLKWITGEALRVEELNTNGKETGVYIHPKFPVGGSRVFYGEWTDRPLAIRNIHKGLNAHLNNILYFPAKLKDRSGEMHPYRVHSLILPERKESKNGKNDYVTKIGFTPLTDENGLLECEDVPAEKLTYKIKNIPYEGVAVKKVTNPEGVEKRFENSFYEACKHHLDVFFAAEMLCTDKMKEVESGQSDYLKSLIRNAKLNGLSVPKLILLPTRWEDGSNYLLIFDEDGTLLGKQYKHTPYVDEKHGKVEALDLSKASNDIYLIHLQNRQRIAVVICAEFLANLDYVRDFVCGWLGVTLILVPSYSKGEQDFASSLKVYNNYGVSVVWGDCCGAVGEAKEKIIGGCSYAGTDAINRFGDCADCGFTCEGTEYCFFKIDLLESIEQEKPSSPKPPLIRHYCY